MLSAQDDVDNELDIEAQNDMAAFMQYSVQYRFGDNLLVGDKVEYKQNGDESNETIYELEVTEKTENGIWIVEKFEGNEVHLLVNLDNGKLLEIWGYDESGNMHEPELLQDYEVEERLQDMFNYSKLIGIPTEYKERESKDLRYDNKTIACKLLYPIINNEAGKFDDKESVIVFSDEIPKMIPFHASISLLNADKYFDDVVSGFVADNTIELKSFIKK